MVKQDRIAFFNANAQCPTCEREDSWKVEIVKMIGNWKFINVGKHWFFV